MMQKMQEMWRIRWKILVTGISHATNVLEFSQNSLA